MVCTILFTFLVVVSVFVHVSYAATLTKPCELYTACSFKFCDDITDFMLGKPTELFTSAICINDPTTITNVTSGEAVVIDDMAKEFGRTRISRWTPDGLNTPFPSTFFTTIPITSSGSSGVTHKQPLGNQESYLNNKCWALQITGYKAKFSDGTVKDVAVSVLPWKNCVAFRTFV